MSLDVLLEPVPVRERTSRLCKAGAIVENLPTDIKLKVADSLATLYVDGGLTDEEWAGRFKRAGHPVSPTVINRHRKNRCCCV